MEEQSQQAAPSEQSQAQTPAPTPTKTEPPPALLDEIKSLRAERAQLREQVADLTGKIEQAQGLEAQLTTTRRDLDLARAGLTDPEAIAVAEVIWGRLPADTRPTLPDWFASVRESGDIPRGLAAYVSAPGASAPGASSSAAEASRGPSTPQPTPGTMTEQAPPAPVDAKSRLQAATEKLHTLRRIGGSSDEMNQARIELQQALTALRR